MSKWISAVAVAVAAGGICASASTYPGGLGNYVWYDVNENGLQDEGPEQGADGVTVNLYDGAGNFLKSTVTENGGFYYFFELDCGLPGNVGYFYYVQFVAPAGYGFTVNDAGGDDAADSDAQPDGITAVTELVAVVVGGSIRGEFDFTWDAGLVPTVPGDEVVVIGDTVWLDRNCNGVQDDVEVGMEGVTVNLYDADNELIDSTTTDEYGKYFFAPSVPVASLPASFVVQFVLPSGYKFTATNATTDEEKDSDADDNGFSHVVVLPWTGLDIEGNQVANFEDLRIDAGLCVEDSGICTRTIGYWKNKPEAWPVDEIEIGGVVYTKAQAIAIMKTPPAGNKVFNMFHQLVATKLNLLQGANAACIIDTVDAADAWLVANGAGVVGSSNPAWVNGGGAMHTRLDEYNNGKLCAAHCDDGGGSPCPKPEPKPCPKPEPKPCPKPEPKPCPKPEPKPSCDWVKKWDWSKCWDAKKGWDWNKGWDWCKKSGGDKNWDKTSDCNTKSGGSKSKKSGGC